jgi:acetyltransferase
MNSAYNPKSHTDSFWRYLFHAESIAVIGAKDTLGSWGGDAMRASVESAKAKEGRRAYPVNPNETEVTGLHSYTTVLDIPDVVDLAIIVVPAAVVPEVFRQCAEKGVKAAVVISAGFSEVDGDGSAYEAEIVDIAQKTGMHFIGPNCMGHADMHTKVYSQGMAGRLPAGPVALLSQSGTLGGSILQIVASRGVGFSKMVSTGNEADLRLEDYLEYLDHDDNTRVIALYIEGLRDGRRFFNLARDITRQKPIVAMKSGITGKSAKAAKSHTGALSGSDEIYSAAFKQAGVIRAEDEEELGDLIGALLHLPLPRGNRTAILTMGGGFGVVATELCEKEGLEIVDLKDNTIEKLREILPPRWTPGNPVDMVGMRSFEDDTAVISCLRLLMADDNIDSVISLMPLLTRVRWLTEDMKPAQIKAMQREYQENLKILYNDTQQYQKPLVFINRLAFRPPDGRGLPEFKPEVIIPEYNHPRRAARVLRSLAWYRHHLEVRKDNRK